METQLENCTNSVINARRRNDSEISNSMRALLNHACERLRNRGRDLPLARILTHEKLEVNEPKIEK